MDKEKINYFLINTLSVAAFIFIYISFLTIKLKSFYTILGLFLLISYFIIIFFKKYYKIFSICIFIFFTLNTVLFDYIYLSKNIGNFGECDLISGGCLLSGILFRFIVFVQPCLIPVALIPFIKNKKYARLLIVFSAVLLFFGVFLFIKFLNLYNLF